MNRPLVSVGLMTYNRAHLLREAVEAWLLQTYPNFELIISDDASQDETPEVCAELKEKDSRIRYIRQPKNLNAPGCFKAVLKEAKGEYFIWASDDDLWDPHFLDECVKKFSEDHELIMVFADMVDIDKRGTPFKHPDPVKYMPLRRNLYERLRDHMLFYFDDGKLQLIFGLWKREWILSDPLFGPHERDDRYPYYWGFDNYIVLKNLAKGSFGFINRTLFFRRSRVLDEYKPPRPLLPRLAITLYHRARKIFASPYFYYVTRRIWELNNLTLWEKVKLTGWNIFVMARIFFTKKV